jgi:hypothetical protein
MQRKPSAVIAAPGADAAISRAEVSRANVTSAGFLSAGFPSERQREQLR